MSTIRVILGRIARAVPTRKTRRSKCWEASAPAEAFLFPTDVRSIEQQTARSYRGWPAVELREILVGMAAFDPLRTLALTGILPNHGKST